MTKKRKSGSTKQVRFDTYQSDYATRLLEQAGCSKELVHMWLSDISQQLTTFFASNPKVVQWSAEGKHALYSNIMSSFVLFVLPKTTNSEVLSNTMFEILIKENIKSEHTVFDVVLHAFQVTFDVHQCAYSFLPPFFPKNLLN